ncbi:MAG: S41 family peptidase [Patescibacteria group bacterium]
MKTIFSRFIFNLSIAAFALLIPLNSALAFYSDVDSDHLYFQEISSLYELNLLPITDEAFQPDELLTNKDLYKILLTYSQAELNKDTPIPYSDLTSTSPYAPYIQTALKLRLLQPSGLNPTFNPDQQVSKSRALQVLFNALGVGTDYFFDKTNFPFKDIGPDSSNAPLAYKAANLQILESDQPTKFKLAKRITKGELAHYLYQIKTNSNNSTGNQSNSTNKPVTVKITTGSTDPVLNNFIDVWNSLKKDFYYKDKLDEKELINKATKALVDNAATKSGDKYTTFEEPKSQSSVLKLLNNEYEGIGVIIETINNNITIISPFKDSPAEKAGLKAADIIVKIDGKSVVGESLETVSSKIKGPKDSQVKITVLRGDKEMEFNVVRKFIMTNSIESEILTSPSGKKIAYISVLTFGSKTSDDFYAAGKTMLASNPDGFIIDLRNNPGGYLDVSVGMVSQFSKTIQTAVQLQYADNHTEDYKANGQGLLSGQKTVVLINEGSASASEIMAGALQDYKLATIIGTKSFGKGSVQQLKSYTDGALFKYTISKWLTPNGHSINEKGITPDKTVTQTGNGDAQLDAALKEF